MEPVKLSISVVSYNSYRDISKLVASIEENTPPELTKKIYIIDNADEQDLFLSLKEKYPDIEYLHTGQNLGFGKGHNQVLPLLNSEYHAIVNPDVELTEDSFGKLISFMEKEQCGMAVPRIVGNNGNRISAYRTDPTLADMVCRIWLRPFFPGKVAAHEMSNQDYSKPFQVPFAQGSFLVTKTDLFERLGGFDDRFFMYLEDADICRRANMIDRIMYCPDTTVIHLWEKGSHKSLKLFRIHIDSWIKYFRKWGLSSHSNKMRKTEAGRQ